MHLRRGVVGGGGGVVHGNVTSGESDAEQQNVGGGDEYEKMANVWLEDAGFRVDQTNAKNRLVQLEFGVGVLLKYVIM